MENEQQLLSAINQGDRAAMRQLYERYKGYAMSIGLRYIAEVSDVEDVVQDSFVTILTSIGMFDYRGEGSLKGWIGRIVANKAFDFVYTGRRARDRTDTAQCADGDDCQATYRLQNGTKPVCVRALLASRNSQ